MKISYNWLQKHIEEKLPNAESLKEAIIFHAFEVEDVEEKNGDTIFVIKVLPCLTVHMIVCPTMAWRKR
jgi:CCR4-NOT transcriptional regulation complex NOT5 subunit